MRLYGKLTSWNEAQGVGAISPDDGSADVPVRMASMPRDGLRPRLGEPLSFELETDADGARRAAGVWRHDARLSIAEAATRKRAAGDRAKSVAIVIALVVIALVAWKALR